MKLHLLLSALVVLLLAVSYETSTRAGRCGNCCFASMGGSGSTTNYMSCDSPLHIFVEPHVRDIHPLGKNCRGIGTSGPNAANRGI